MNRKYNTFNTALLLALTLCTVTAQYAMEKMEKEFEKLSLNETEQEQQTAMELSHQLFNAAESGSGRKVVELLEKGAKPRLYTNSAGQNAAEIAFEKKNTWPLYHLLKAGAEMRDKTKAQSFVDEEYRKYELSHELFNQAEGGSDERVKELLEQGVDPNLYKKGERTAADVAYDNSNIWALKYLLKAGAIVHETTPGAAQSLVDETVLNENLFDAAKEGNETRVIELLQQGAMQYPIYNYREYQLPLHASAAGIAFMNKHIGTLKHLLKAGGRIMGMSEKLFLTNLVSTSPEILKEIFSWPYPGIKELKENLLNITHPSDIDPSKWEEIQKIIRETPIQKEEAKSVKAQEKK